MSEINKELASLLARGDREVFIKQLKSLEKNLQLTYRKSLTDVQYEVVKLFAQFGQDVQFSDLMKYKRLHNLMKIIASELKTTNSAVKTLVNQELKYSYSQTYYYTGYATEKALEINLGFGLLQKEAVNAAILNPYDLIGWKGRNKKWTEEAVLNIRQNITTGVQKGQGYNQIAKQIQNTVEITATKSNVIAQTELHRVTQAGKQKGITRAIRRGQKLGLNMEKFWISTLDESTRANHQFMDGIVAGKDGMFQLYSGGVTDSPGNSGIPEEDINCRCTTGLRVKQTQQYRRDNISGKVIKYKTFNDWKKVKGI